MGDGLPVEFHSVVDALRCAVEVQRAEAERNAYLPIDRRMVFRIGINLGNVIVGGNDIHGDGVNIAHRLQQLADCGGVVISGTTYDWVENKLEVGFESLGERRVKNVAKPLRVYRVRMEAEAAGKTFGVRQAAARVLRRPIIAVGALAVLIVVGIAAWSLPREQGVNSPSILRTALPPADKPSIAVLPFGNVGPKSEEAYFAQGLTDDLITDPSKISGLLVVARNSTSGYRDPTWSSPVRMNDVPTGHQFFPSIVADGNDIHVAWFDGRLNPAGSMITQLQVFYNRSIDSGASFEPDIAVSEQPFDPNQVSRFPVFCAASIGDYIDIDAVDGRAAIIWSDNSNVENPLTPGECRDFRTRPADPAIQDRPNTGALDQDAFVAIDPSAPGR
jgi:Adenylate and Guanylate cyclase catalytic domain